MITKFARLISNVLNPIPMILLVGAFSVFVTPLAANERIFWILLFGSMVIIVGFVLIWFVRMGYVFDARLSKDNDRHRDRLGMLWITDALLVVSILTAWMLGRPTPLWNVLVGTTVMLILATIVTNFYKISFHMIGITSIVTVLILYYGVAATPALILIPLMAWSRRVLNRHTPMQIISGTVLTALSYIIVFMLLGR